MFELPGAPEGEVTSELLRETDEIHSIGFVRQGDPKYDLPNVLPEETTPLAANVLSVATVSNSLARNISSQKSGSPEPMVRHGISKSPKTPFVVLDQAEVLTRDVDPGEIATIGWGSISELSPGTRESSPSKLDTSLSGIASRHGSTDSVDSDLLTVSETSE